MRGLLAIEPLYHQIKAGNKTQTRRSGGLDEVNGREAIKNKPAILTNPDNWKITGWLGEMGGDLASVDFCDYRDTQRNVVCKPRYKVNEILYVKEPIILTNPTGEIIYKYDQKEPARSFFKWKNKLFMPASDARSFVRITGVKCEQLRGITEEDCIAEGIEVFNGLVGYWQVYDKKTDTMFTKEPKRSFWSLYRLANKMPMGNIPNIWVWAYSFEYLPDYHL